MNEQIEPLIDADAPVLTDALMPWVTPEVTEFAVTEITQASSGAVVDGTTYS
jgi:hypothetical protein